MIQALLFYLFAGTMLASAVMVILARNPVHSVLWLILAFLNAAGLFLAIGAEFLALILMIVYVGAVAVLFLFVVMMLDIDFAELREGFIRYLPLGLVIGLVIAVELIMAGSVWAFGDRAMAARAAPVPAETLGLYNIQALGTIIYTDYVFVFEAAGLILLVAMIGAIVLTMRHRPGVKRQSVAKQNARSSIAETVRPAIGAGVDTKGGVQ